MIEIDNSLRYDLCPLCSANIMYKVGNINYYLPMKYSTELISLMFTPELWRCSVCESAFVQNAVPEPTSVLLYKQGKSNELYVAVDCEEPKTNVVTETFKNFFKRDLRLLDIGCNTGEVLDFARNRGCRTFGVEYSLSSLDVLKNKGHTVFSDIKDVNVCFDIITAFDLVEHIYNLPKFLEICLNLLAPNGHLIFLTGDINCFWARFTKANWWYVKFTEHITFPSKKYFELHPQLQIVDWIPTYADRAYDRPKLRVAMSIAKRLLLRDYCGLPALSPDHALIIVKRRNDL